MREQVYNRVRVVTNVCDIPQLAKTLIWVSFSLLLCSKRYSLHYNNLKYNKIKFQISHNFLLTDAAPNLLGFMMEIYNLGQSRGKENSYRDKFYLY